MAIKLWGFALISFLTSIFTAKIANIIHDNATDKLITDIYNYQKINKKFPKNLILFESHKKGYYETDSALTSFKFYCKDMYGIPRVFNSIDSSWNH